MLEKLDGALGSSTYTGLNAEFTANATLLDYFQQLNTNWFARVGFARAHGVSAGTAGRINLPNHFMNYMFSLELRPGYTIQRLFEGPPRGFHLQRLGNEFEELLTNVLQNAFSRGRVGISAAEIPTDLKNYYLSIYDQGYTKLVTQVTIQTPLGSTPRPDIFFFRTRNNGLLNFNDVIYHDAKLDVSTNFSPAQGHIRQAMQDANVAGTKAQFQLAADLTFEGRTYTKGNVTITLKEMSSVHTKLQSNSIKLSRAVEVEN